MERLVEQVFLRKFFESETRPMNSGVKGTCSDDCTTETPLFDPHEVKWGIGLRGYTALYSWANGGNWFTSASGPEVLDKARGGGGGGGGLIEAGS